MDYSRNRSFSALVTILAILAASGCAKISSPTGGPKDVDPPVILKSEPENGTVMFREKGFRITFDEYIVLDKITEKFMVSPPLENKPEIKLKGRELIVSWEDELADSTTYTFYFQDAIRDNNETNPIPNYQYVFSTGSILDSLSVTGNVFDALTLEYPEDVMVMMYSDLADSAPRKNLPAYISKPDKSGGFVISNVRPGSYRLFALKDMNGNKIYDLEDETFAFLDTIIAVTPEDNAIASLDSVSHKAADSPESVKPTVFTYGKYPLYSFVAETKKQYLKFAERKAAGSLSFGLALPDDSSDFSVTLKDIPREAWFIENNMARDSFRIWITNPDIYKQDLIEACVTHPFTDSTGAIILKIDTVALRFHTAAPPRGGARRQASTFSTNIGTQMKPGTSLWFRNSSPMNVPDTSKMTLYQVMDTIRKRVTVTVERDSMDACRYRLASPLKQGTNYFLVCKNGAFTDIYGSTSDSTATRFRVSSPEDYGSVTMELTGYEGSVIVQVLGAQEKVLRETVTTSPGKVLFDLLDKGKVRVRIIYDFDGSGKWTTGNYRNNISPEPVTYYPSELDIRINWQLEQEWDISLKNRKEVSLRTRKESNR